MWSDSTFRSSKIPTEDIELNLEDTRIGADVLAHVGCQNGLIAGRRFDRYVVVQAQHRRDWSGYRAGLTAAARAVAPDLFLAAVASPPNSTLHSSLRPAFPLWPSHLGRDAKCMQKDPVGRESRQRNISSSDFVQQPATGPDNTFNTAYSAYPASPSHCHSRHPHRRSLRRSTAISVPTDTRLRMRQVAHPLPVRCSALDPYGS